MPDGESLHGYAIMQAVSEMTQGRETILPGTLYAALARMVDEGLVARRPRRTTTRAADRRAAITAGPVSGAPSRAPNRSDSARCSTSPWRRESSDTRNDRPGGATAIFIYTLALRAFPPAHRAEYQTR